MRFLATIIATVALAAGLAQADCRQRAVIVHQNRAAAVVVDPFIFAVPIPFFVPLYSVGQAYAPPQIREKAPCSPSDELAALRAEVAELRKALKAQGPPLGANAQPPQPNPNREKIPPPKDDGSPDLEDVAKVFTARCAACHEAAVAATKGGKLALMAGDQVAPITAEKWLEVLRRADAKTMPPKDKQGQYPALTDEEIAILIQAKKERQK